jgi:hypothetical protein
MVAICTATGTPQRPLGLLHRPEVVWTLAHDAARVIEIARRVVLSAIRIP